MTLPNWWLRRVFRFATTKRRPSQRSIEGRFRPSLEQIEERLVPATITVTSSSDDISDTGSLRYALSVANPGDTIDFAAGISTIDLTSGSLDITKDLNIVNDGDNGPITIDGNGQFTVFTIDSGVTATLSALTISDGTATDLSDGGAITNQGNLTVDNCTFSNNSAWDGGGINNSGTLTVNNSNFDDNSATYGTLSISGGETLNLGGGYGTLICPPGGGGTFSIGGDGGAVYNSGTATFNEATFTNNVSTSDSEPYQGEYDNTGGGAIGNRGSLSVTASTFSNNSANGLGGGINNLCGSVDISSSTFSNNFAAGGGGGLVNQGTLFVSNSTFFGNTAFQANFTSDGGGIFNYIGSAEIDECTISDNSASQGGGLWTTDAPCILHGDIIVGNFNADSSAPDDIWGGVWDNFTTYTCSSSDNLVGTGIAEGDLDMPDGNVLGPPVLNYNNNRLDVSLADVDLGPLADNGGPTETMALLPGSIAIGTGVTANTPTFDQRGEPRPIGTPSDVGAYQYCYVVPQVILNPSNQTLLEKPGSSPSPPAVPTYLTANGVQQSSTGNVVTFSAGAIGTPTPNVIWQVSVDHGKTFINLKPGGVYGNSVNTPILTITGAAPAMQGFEYRAVFSNRSSKAAAPRIVATKPATLTVDVPATIQGTVSTEKTNDLTAIRPFSRVGLVETGNSAELQTLQVTLSDSLNGILVNLGEGLFSNGVYTLDNVTLAQAQAALRALVFVPTKHQVAPLSKITTSFTISLTDAAGTATNSNTAVITTATESKTLIAGAQSRQTIHDNQTVMPFSTLTLTNPDANETYSVTIVLNAATHGTLSGSGFTESSNGVYTLSRVTLDVAQADLQSLLFEPTQEGKPGKAVSTGFKVIVTDESDVRSINAVTSVIAIDE